MGATVASWRAVRSRRCAKSLPRQVTGRSQDGIGQALPQRRPAYSARLPRGLRPPPGRGPLPDEAAGRGAQRFAVAGRRAWRRHHRARRHQPDRLEHPGVAASFGWPSWDGHHDAQKVARCSSGAPTPNAWTCGDGRCRCSKLFDASTTGPRCLGMRRWRSSAATTSAATTATRCAATCCSTQPRPNADWAQTSCLDAALSPRPPTRPRSANGPQLSAGRRHSGDERERSQDRMGDQDHLSGELDSRLGASGLGVPGCDRCRGAPDDCA